jgi:DNA-binding NtrC family response regulator
MIELRLVLARGEAVRGNSIGSRRNLAAAGKLLKDFPNSWLQGRLHLALSIVNSIEGDPQTSAQEARLAIQLGARAGHARTELAGLTNLAHALQMAGEFSEARRCIDVVLGRAYEDFEIQVAALDSMCNILIATSELTEAEQIADRIDESIARKAGLFHSRWLELTRAHTRARLLQAQGRWSEADKVLEGGISAASVREGVGASLRLQLLRLKGKLELDEQDDAATLLGEIERHPLGPELIGQRTRVLSSARSIRPGRADEMAVRSVRLAEALRSSVLVEGALGGSSQTLPAQDLDTAVALLELGGHPHILAAEAMAVLKSADCAAALALVAQGEGKPPRILEIHNCDQRRGVAMARKPDGFEVIPLGEHRGEPWLIVAEPRPGLDHRCTLIAIRKLIDTAVTLDRYRRDEKQRAALWPADALDGDADSIWASEQMAEVLHIARRIAPTPLSVLVTGETGTGKEVLARTIHRASDRAGKLFQPFNCSAVPRDMLESQLFGHRKGAFTGADTAFQGVIRSAAGGTLFLDEIGEVPLDLQPKLLRFLEAHEIHPLGEPHPMTVDVRVIAATNAPLEQLVAEGRLREDLFYRLNVIRLQLPPLRERREEIPPLVEHYLRRCGDEQKKGRLTISDETLEYLLLYSWPGNLRQLANEIRRVVALAEPDAVITPSMLSPELQASRRTIPATAPAADDADAEVRLRIDQPLPAAVEFLEQVMVRNALTRSQGRVEEAARLLGISRKGLFLKRRRWGFHASPS